MMSPIETARTAARSGGAIVAEGFQEGVTIFSSKNESYNLVSESDVESERAIVRVIRDSFPDHMVLGEELHRGDTNGEHLWVVDPLDGTNNFAHGIPHFAVSIAYYHNGDPQCGVIYNPARGDWFEVERGRGAFHNGDRVSVAESESLDEVLIGVGFYYDRGAMMESTLAAVRDLFREHIHGIRRFGTASLDLVQVGLGMFGAFFEYELSPWDFAAGRLFVEEAGGQVTTCGGDPLPLTCSGVLASNRRLHQDVLAIVSAHRPLTE